VSAQPREPSTWGAEALRAWDPQLREAWEAFRPPLPPDDDVVRLRATYAAWHRELATRSEAPPADLSVEAGTVRSHVDGHAIPIRVYRPHAPVDGRGLLFLHSGAFILDGLDAEDTRCRRLASAAGCVVVAVDYRVVPEHRYPVPLDDCDAVLLWIGDRLGELAIDARRLAVGGCSAGGTLAASLAQRCRDRGGPALAGQLLLYPVLDATLSGASLRQLLTEEELAAAAQSWERYLDGADGAPAQAADLAGLPPAYVLAGERDPYRDDAIAYAQRLLGAGVPVDLHVWARVPHAIEMYVPDVPLARALYAEQADALARLLG